MENSSLQSVEAAEQTDKPEHVLQHLPLHRATAQVIENPFLAPADNDWSSWYLTDEEDVGQGTEHCRMIFELLSALEELGRERKWDSVLAASDQYFAWVPSEPMVRVSPDVYLLDDPPGPPWPGSWQTWLPGHGPPRFAVEVVSMRYRAKDYEINPFKYAQLGTRELVIVDSNALEAGDGMPPIQIYRRRADGAFAQAYVGDGPAYCDEINASILFVCDPGGERHLRLSRDWRGRDIVPTSKERVDGELARADAEKERADNEKERADSEKERADSEKERADSEKERADSEKERADSEKARADAAERRLRALSARPRRRNDIKQS